jgi:DNA modification methylase
MSNPGDVIYDPFGGLMTVPTRAVALGRFGIGCELNPGYWLDGCSYLKAAEEKITTPTLFSLLEAEEALLIEEGASE